jgi:hypothetical protein
MATWQLTNKGFSLDLVHNIDYWQFNTAFVDGSVEGRLQWNSEDGTLEYGLPGGNVTLQIGQEQLVKCVNNTGSTIEDGDVVYVSGAAGSRPEISLASSATGTGNVPIGMATEDIEHTNQGYVNIGGLVRGIDTSAIASGSVGFLSESVPGALRATPPDAPNYTTVVGYCLFSDADVGIFLVRVLSAPRLVSLSDTLAGDPDDGDVYKWNEANDRFELSALGAGTGDLLADGSVPMTADWPFGDFSLLIGDDANAKMTLGLTINQGEADDEILAFKSSDVDHGGTNVTEADTYGLFGKIQAGTGGLFMIGVSEGAPNKGIEMVGLVTTNITAKDNNADGCVNIRGGKIVGGSIGSNDANSNLLTVQDGAATRWIIDAGGVTWQSGSIFIGDDANTKMTLGITINQGAADDDILAFKSSDVNHGMTDVMETDTFCRFIKEIPAGGGLRVISAVDADGGSTAMRFIAYTVNAADTTSGQDVRGIFETYCSEISGTGVGNVTAGGCIISHRARIEGASKAKWALYITGNTWQLGSITLGSQELTETDLTDLLDGGETALHSHAGGGGGGAATDITVDDATLDKFLASFDEGTDDLQDLIEMVDEQAVEVIQQDAEPETTYPGMIWVDTDADPAGSNVTSFIQDDNQDTKIQCEEGGADEDKMRFDAGGSEVGIWDAVSLTMPLQPTFYVTLGIADANFAINTNHVTEVDTIVFDIGDNFDTETFTFTAPVDGKYILSATWRLGVTLDTAAQYYEVRIITSNRPHTTLLAPKWTVDPNYHAVHVCVVADMDANDTAFMRHYQQGGSPQTDCSVFETRFSGIKVA